jgi:hypothetical protein
MSYDNVFVDNVRLPRGAAESLATELLAEGNYVSLAHGSNSLTDDLFLFDTPELAEDFYNAGFRVFEFVDGEGGTYGFDSVRLFKHGLLSDEKFVPPTEPPLSTLEDTEKFERASDWADHNV